jgi:predicted transposase YdaD
LEIHELITPIDRWTYFIKYATKLDVIPDFAQTDDGLTTAFLEADKHSWTKEERIAYDNVLIKEADEIQEKIKAEEKAKEKGKEEGKEEKEIEAVLGLNRIGLENEKIADALNMKIEKIEEIIAKHTQ